MSVNQIIHYLVMVMVLVLVANWCTASTTSY